MIWYLIKQKHHIFKILQQDLEIFVPKISELVHAAPKIMAEISTTSNFRFYDYKLIVDRKVMSDQNLYFKVGS